MVETDEAILIDVELSGVKREDVHLEVGDKVLHIARERRAQAQRQGRNYHYLEPHYDQGLELLTGVPAGDAETPDTVHGLLNARLHPLARDMVAFGETRSNGVQKSGEVNAIGA